MENSTHLEKKSQGMVKFMAKLLFLTAIAAKAQAQEAKAPEVNKQDPKTEIPTNTEDKSGLTSSIGSGLIASVTAHEDKTQGSNGTTLYADFTPNASITATDKHGDFARFSAMESFTVNNKDLNALTIKFMLELGKQLGDGSEIVLKAGRESTQASSVYDVAMHHYADAQNIGDFGNLSNLLAIRYTKDGIGFGEIGLIGSINDGTLGVLPNMEEPNLWVKGGLQAFNKCTLEAAAKLGKKQKELLGSLGFTPNASFKGRIMGKYDLVERSGAVSADFVKDINHKLKIMAGGVFKQNKEYRIHVGVDKGNVQLSGEYVKPNGQPGTANITLATQLNWARSKLPKH